MKNSLTLAIVMVVASSAASGGAEVPSTLDKKAVNEALSAVDLKACKVKGGPTGEGHVLLTITPKGLITDVVVDKAPFAGSKSSKCIEKAYRKIKVSPFEGSPVVLGKKFTLE